ncbi:CpaE family protein [Psychromicrobium sp. YIM B11713]|uniref:AAA family ATPase n=1 Tax=Psychromicrobium sp. YIM B11713 TaxID=3145233 RepID=UPI00374E5A4B
MTVSVAVFGASGGRLITELERLHSSLTVVRHCLELSELVAACQSGLAQVAIVTEQLDQLNAALLERLAAFDVMVLALSDDDDLRQRLSALGVCVLPGQSSSEELLKQITGKIKTDGRILGIGSANGAVDPDSGSAKAGTAHRLVAVWGPIGSPGRTTVAVNLAAELAAAGRRVMLVDADSYGASIAATLGLLDESAGIAQAARLADQGLLDETKLLEIAPEVGLGPGKLRVLTGLTRPDRWMELRALSLAKVFEHCRETFEITVVDCGFSLESDDELSFDSYLPGRNAATLTAFAAADQIFAVGSADSLGVPRLIRALQELDQVLPEQSITVVLNKVRATAAGRRPERALQEAWQRFGPRHPISHFLPWDPESSDRALLAGQVFLEAAPEVSLRKKLCGLVGAFAQ